MNTLLYFNSQFREHRRQPNLKEGKGKYLGRELGILVSRPCFVQLQGQDPKYRSQSTSVTSSVEL